MATKALDVIAKLPTAKAPDSKEIKADGLTPEEARDLVAWLQESGYKSIEVIQEAGRCSVIWSK